MNDLAIHKITRLGLPKAIPPAISMIISQIALVMRDIERLDEAIKIFSIMQTDPHTYSGSRSRCDAAVHRAGYRIGEILMTLESDILNIPISITTNIAYHWGNLENTTTWRILGQTTNLCHYYDKPCAISTSTTRTFSQQKALCELKDTKDCGSVLIVRDISTVGWDGTLPNKLWGGSRYSDSSFDGGRLFPGWFAREIAFLRKLKKVII